MASSPEPARQTEVPDKALTAEQFLRCVLRSELLSREDLQAALANVASAWRDDPAALADHLVRAGKLTRFQANKLLRGIAQGMILGPYRVLAPLGRGGMAKVFLVRDTRNDQLVALKILPPRLARTEGRMLARFRREMEMSQRVAHPHLAWTSEVGEFRGMPYIAMEYIPGQTLSRLVGNEGPLVMPRAARLMAEVASALDHAHSQGLIHRDLKPSNILVTPREHAKVLDLGLALIHGETVTDNTVVGGQGYIVGTMDYIAPEQTLDAAAVDRRSDIYSLGCTLYFALTGQPPFPGGTGKEKIRRHRMEEPERLARRAPWVPAGFVELVERMMRKDPELRPGSAAEVEKELRAWAAGEAEQPPDTLSDLAFDESAIMRQRGSSEDYSLVVVPDLQEVEEVTEPGGFSTSALVLLGLGAGLLALLAAVVTLLAMSVQR
jgi:serine/threonine protein kinase